MREVRDTEYEQVVARAFALLSLVVLGTIVGCVWKICHVFFQF